MRGAALCSGLWDSEQCVYRFEVFLELMFPCHSHRSSSFERHKQREREEKKDQQPPSEDPPVDGEKIKEES